MEVFISWSGRRGEFIANCIADMLEQVNHQLRSYVSARVRAGDDWRSVLNDKLNNADAAVIVVTPESRESDWLHYEAGALRFGNPARPVIPLCFELGTNELSGPISQFQARAFDAANMLEVSRQLNAMLPSAMQRDDTQISRTFGNVWNSEFVAKLPDLSSMRLNYDETFKALLDGLSSAGCGEVVFTSTYRFDSGFEDWQLYDTVFRHAQRRLWVLGRKNRKVFDKSFKWFFERASKNDALRESLRFLFLSPEAPAQFISAAHKDADFVQQLQTSISTAASRLSSSGLEPGAHCRTYQALRNYHVVVCDDAVLYAPVNLDAGGQAASLTGGSFQVADATTAPGMHLIKMVDDLWERSATLKST